MKWGGTSLTLLFLVAWIGSCVWWFGWFSPGDGSVFVGQGRLTVLYFDHVIGDLFPAENMQGLPPRRASATMFGRADYIQMNVHLEWFRGPVRQPALCIPLWIPFVAFAIITAGVWRLDTLARRRARVGKCLTCGYDRTGLASDVVCPECGTLSKA